MWERSLKGRERKREGQRWLREITRGKGEGGRGEREERGEGEMAAYLTGKLKEGL